MGRRILSIWFPRLASERHQRAQWGGEELSGTPFAVIAEDRSAKRIACLNARGEAAGLTRTMALTDARAIVPDLRTVPAMPDKDAAFLTRLRRWAGRYSPWVSEDGTDGLIIDVTGCTHLFVAKTSGNHSVSGPIPRSDHPPGYDLGVVGPGERAGQETAENGEAEMLADIAGRLERFGLTARAALADTRGAAWGLARYGPPAAIAPVGKTRKAIGSLPLGALRLEQDVVHGLMRLGIKTVWEAALLPRAALAKRFGVAAVRRLDQALGAEPEPVSPAAPPLAYATRLSLPEPVGKTEDVMAALDRLLERLTARLDETGMGARRLRLTVRQVDHSENSVEIGLARPSRDSVRICRLFERPVDKLEAGFGIEMIRLQAIVVEPLTPVQRSGIGSVNRTGAEGEDLAELLGRIGNRIGFDRVQRFLPADSHIPEKGFSIAAAAYSEAATWPRLTAPRPLLLFPPEPVTPHEEGAPPALFSWRRQCFAVLTATGPERITPQWWLDDPAWRSGLRDYWQVETEKGRRLWLFHIPQAGPETLSSGWFVHGEFA